MSAEAEQRLAESIAKKHQPARDREQTPSSITVAVVLSVYVTDHAPTVASANELGRRVKALAGFFGKMMLSDINRAVCRAYAAQRGSPSMARRELEDLRAAINHHRREGVATARKPRQHVPRFLLVGLYTGTRSGAAPQRKHGKGFVELDAGRARSAPADDARDDVRGHEHGQAARPQR